MPRPSRAALSTGLEAGLVALLVASLAGGPVFAAPSSRLLPVHEVAVAAASGPRVVPFAIGLDPAAKGQLGWLIEGAESAIAASERFTLVPPGDLFDPDGASR